MAVSYCKVDTFQLQAMVLVEEGYGQNVGEWASI